MYVPAGVPYIWRDREGLLGPGFYFLQSLYLFASCRTACEAEEVVSC